MKDTIQPAEVVMADKLKIKVFESRSDLGAAGGDEVAAKIRELLQEKDRIRMIFGSAPSQNEFLDRLSEAGGIDWSRITVFHMDEYIGLPDASPQKFSAYLLNRLFRKVEPGQVHLIDSSRNPAEECERYGALLAESPIDIVCLGIGENGHLAFNDPPAADFADPLSAKIVELDPVCRRQQVNDGAFLRVEDVPKQAVTLTIPALFSGAFLFGMVPGPTKRKAVMQTVRGPISTACPASVLRTHENCILYVDTQSFGD